MKKWWFRLVLTPLALCAVMAFLRWMETFHVIQGKDVVFQQLHDLTWDSYERKLTRTGGDPYAWFKLPPAALPLTRVTIDFGGTYVPGEGTYYFFPSPANEAEGVLGAQTAAEARSIGSAFTVTCELPAAKALRMDLPDFLGRPVEIDRMEIRTAFWSWKSWRLRLTVLSGAAAIAGAVTLLVQSRPSGS